MSASQAASSSSNAFASFRSRVSKPSVNIHRSEKIASLLPLALIAPEPRHAHCGAEFPGFCLLLTCDPERALEVRFRFCRIRGERHERDFTGNAIYIGFGPPVLGRFRNCGRFAKTAPSIIELVVEFGMGHGQI